jgi:hypothetical protein
LYLNCGVAMKLYSHIVMEDNGLAPNPFHGFCTQALGIPSHVGVSAGPGDWLIGNTNKADNYKLIYAMEILEPPLTMDEYFADKRFESKKPDPAGKLEDQCGDNIYHKENGRWKCLKPNLHNDIALIKKDLGLNLSHPKRSRVYISKHFYYFGVNRVEVPSELSDVLHKGIGISLAPSHIVPKFIEWLEELKPHDGEWGKPLHPKEIGFGPRREVYVDKLLF